MVSTENRVSRLHPPTPPGDRPGQRSYIELSSSTNEDLIVSLNSNILIRIDIEDAKTDDDLSKFFIFGIFMDYHTGGQEITLLREASY